MAHDNIRRAAIAVTWDLMPVTLGRASSKPRIRAGFLACGGFSGLEEMPGGLGIIRCLGPKPGPALTV